jgi:hypothetical protein
MDGIKDRDGADVVGFEDSDGIKNTDRAVDTAGWIETEGRIETDEIETDSCPETDG